jgi:hypothetical protein
MSPGNDIPDASQGGNYHFCLDCGAPNFPGSAKCFLCGHDLTAIRQGVKPPPLPPMRGPMTYSLSTLFLIVTLAGVCFGLIAAAPVLGIPLAVLMVPALLRTFEISSERKARGEEPGVEKLIGSFLSTFVSIVLLIVAAGAALCAAFFALCISMNRPSGPSPTELLIAIGFAIGAAATFLAANWLFKRAGPTTGRSSHRSK